MSKIFPLYIINQWRKEILWLGCSSLTETDLNILLDKTLCNLQSIFIYYTLFNPHHWKCRKPLFLNTYLYSISINIMLLEILVLAIHCFYFCLRESYKKLCILVFSISNLGDCNVHINKLVKIKFDQWMFTKVIYWNES